MEDVSPKLEEWFRANVTEDVEECMQIASVAVDTALEKFDVSLPPKTMLGVYSMVIDSTIEFLAQKRTDNEDMFIVDLGALRIGYTNSGDDGEDEVPGGFNIFMEEKPEALKFQETEGSSAEKLANFVQLNAKDSLAVVTKIDAAAVKKCADIGITIAGGGVTIGLMACLHMHLVSYMKTKMDEKMMSEKIYDYKLNFCNNFEVHCQLLENSQKAITYKPNIAGKLSIKSNAIATAPLE